MFSVTVRNRQQMLNGGPGNGKKNSSWTSQKIKTKLLSRFPYLRLNLNAGVPMGSYRSFTEAPQPLSDSKRAEVLLSPVIDQLQMNLEMIFCCFSRNQPTRLDGKRSALYQFLSTRM
jgi:hypothetical protein